MPANYPGRKSVTLQIPLEQYKRVALAAEARDLNDNAFITMVLLGAISQGGGTLERLIDVGSRVVPQLWRKRKSKDPTREDWKYVKPGHWQFGDWILTKSRLTRSKGKGDTNFWWQLSHKDHPTIQKPVAFDQREAFREASHIIKSGYNPATQ